MKYGEEYVDTWVNRTTGEIFSYTAVYKYVSWHGFHTNNHGNGLWFLDTQIEGTCQFTVTGCKTEKAAKDKIRRYIKAQEVKGECL